jgi:hypothetical protein
MAGGGHGGRGCSPASAVAGALGAGCCGAVGHWSRWGGSEFPVCAAQSLGWWWLGVDRKVSGAARAPDPGARAVLVLLPSMALALLLPVGCFACGLLAVS